MSITKKYKLHNDIHSKVGAHTIKKTIKNASLAIIMKKQSKLFQQTKKKTKYKKQRYNNPRTLDAIQEYKDNQKQFKIQRISTQKGGIINIFKHKYNMYKFNKLIKDINKEDKILVELITKYKAQFTIFKNYADKIAIDLTDYIQNFKAHKLQEYALKQDKITVLRKEQITRDISTVNTHLNTITTKISTIRHKLKSDIPKLNKHIKKFKKNTAKFQKLHKKYDSLSAWITNINLVVNNAKEQAADKKNKDVTEYNSHKVDYDKVASFNDTYINNYQKQLTEITKLLDNADYYKTLGNDESSTSKLSKTVKDDALKKWSDTYTILTDTMNKLIEINNAINDELTKLLDNAHSIKGATISIFNDKLELRNSNAILEFIKSIESLIELFKVARHDVIEINLELYKSTPAASLNANSSQLEAAFNSGWLTIKNYNRIFRNIIDKSNNIQSQLFSETFVGGRIARIARSDHSGRSGRSGSLKMIGGASAAVVSITDVEILNNTAVLMYIAIITSLYIHNPPPPPPAPLPLPLPAPAPTLDSIATHTKLQLNNNPNFDYMTNLPYVNDSYTYFYKPLNKINIIELAKDKNVKDNYTEANKICSAMHSVISKLSLVNKIIESLDEIGRTTPEFIYKQEPDGIKLILDLTSALLTTSLSFIVFSAVINKIYNQLYAFPDVYKRDIPNPVNVRNPILALPALPNPLHIFKDKQLAFKDSIKTLFNILMQTIPPVGGVPPPDAAAAAVAIVASIENPDITLGSKQIPPKNPVINSDVYTLLNDGDALNSTEITELEKDIKIAICDNTFTINNADTAIIGISKVLALNIKLILYKYYNLNENINNIKISKDKQTVIDTFSNFVEQISSLETIDSNTKYISSNYILNFKLKKTQIESIKYTDKLTDTQIKNIHPRNIQYFEIKTLIHSKYLKNVKLKPKYNEMYFSAEQILDLIQINTNTSVLKDVVFTSLALINDIKNSDIYGPEKTVGNVICTAVNLYYYICNEINIIINKDITKLVNQYFDLMLLLYYTVNDPHNSSPLSEEYDKFLQEKLKINIELDNNKITTSTELTNFKTRFKDKNEINPNKFFNNNTFDIDTCNLTLEKVYKKKPINNSTKFLEAMAIYYTTKLTDSISSYKDYLKYLYNNVSPPTHSFTVDDAHTELKDYTKFINKIYLESYVKKRTQNLNIQPIVLDKDNLNQHYANMCKCKDPKLSLFIYDTSFTNYLNTGTEIEPNTSEIVSEGRQDKHTKTLKTLPEINYMSLGIPFFDKKDIIEKLKTNSKFITTNNKPDTEMTNYAEYENESTLITIDNNTKNDAYEIFLQSLINIYIFVKTHSKDKDLTIYYCSKLNDINNNKYTIDFNKDTVITNNNTMWNSENHINLIKEHISYLFQQIEKIYQQDNFQYNHGQDAYDSTYKICNIDEGLAIESIKIVKNNKTCNDIKTESTPSDIEDTSEITNGYIEKDKEINKQYIEIEKLIKNLTDAYKNLQDIKTDTLSTTKAENKKIYESILNKFTTEKQKFIALIEIQKQILETKIKHINTEITQLKKDLGQAGGSGSKVLIPTPTPTPTSPSKTPPKLTIEVIASKKELLVTKEKELIKCKELLIIYDTQQQTIETLTKPIITDVNAAYPDIQQSVSVNPLTQQKALEIKYELIINEKTPSLQNILLSIDKIKFSEQYNNVRMACNNIISITNTIDKNYAVLLPNMQTLTQYLNKLITIEPNVKDIIVKPPPTTLTAFSFILKPDPNSPEGQEFQLLTGTNKIANLIQQNTLAAAMFADTTVLSDSEIQTYLLNLSTENKIATANLFTQNMKLIDSEYNINKFISAVTKYYTPSIPGIEKQVCNIYKNLLQISTSKPAIYDIINNSYSSIKSKCEANKDTEKKTLFNKAAYQSGFSPNLVQQTL